MSKGSEQVLVTVLTTSLRLGSQESIHFLYTLFLINKKEHLFELFYEMQEVVHPGIVCAIKYATELLRQMFLTDGHEVIENYLVSLEQV